MASPASRTPLLPWTEWTLARIADRLAGPLRRLPAPEMLEGSAVAIVVPSVVGVLEGRRRQHVTGWAYDPLRPHRPVALTVLAGDRRFAIVADHYRYDVRRAGHASSFCGFSVPLADLDEAGRVRVVMHGTRRDLPGSPLDLLADEPSAALAFQAERFVLHLHQRSAAAGLSGFAYDPATPYARCHLVLHDATGPIARLNATQYARDCRFSGDDGLHGFAFPQQVERTGPFHLTDEASGSSVPVEP